MQWLHETGGWLTVEKVRRAASRAGGIALAGVDTAPDGRFRARLVFAGPWAAARFLVEVAKEDVGDPVLYRIAMGIKSRSPTPLEYARNVQAWVQSNIRFAKEPVETFQSGRMTVETRVGDCDCHSKLVYALLVQGGGNASMSFLDAGGAPVHAYANAILGGRAWPLETTLRARFGEAPLAAARRLGVKTRSDLESGKVVTIGAMGEMVEGVDFAQYAGQVDYKALAESVAFAFVRSGDGLGTDHRFDANWRGVHDVPMIAGAYQFFSPNLDPVAQADKLVSQLGGSLALTDLPPAIDLEVLRGASGAAAIAAAVAWADRIQDRLGVSPVLYTAPGFYDVLPSGPFDGRLDLWVANWGVRSPKLPRGWTEWKFWQYAAERPSPGVEGKVDVNVFNGSRVELAAYAAKKVSAPVVGGGSSGPPPLPPSESPSGQAPQCAEEVEGDGNG